MSLLAEIGQWKLEAESEDANRYFYHVDELSELESGAKHFVIGRKGTGKTAICEYFQSKCEYNCFTTKLSFKEFPFNILYELEDHNFTRPSQYISLWKYLIYNSILKMMSQNFEIDAQIRAKLTEIYPDEPLTQMQRAVKRWTSREVGMQIIGVGGNISSEYDIRDRDQSWYELIPVMEDIISRYGGEASYYVVFDELDEDYRSYWQEEAREKYVALLTSLFKAVSNIKRSFKNSPRNILPIVFLRDDIYQILSDPDGNKWEDDKVYLRWTKSSLKRLIAWRISRSDHDEEESPPMNFDEALEKISTVNVMGIGSGKSKQIGVFDYISTLTHDRPRDFVRYFRDCARSSIAQGHSKIQKDTIRGIEKEYSNHLKTELVNEMEGIVPDIRSLFEHIGNQRKDRFSSNNFYSVIDDFIRNESLYKETTRLGVARICKILFHFSVIGNALARDRNVPRYKYQNEYLVYNPNATVVVHRGLLRSFGIIDPFKGDEF